MTPVTSHCALGTLPCVMGFLDHVISFGQLNVSKQDASRGLDCFVGFDVRMAAQKLPLLSLSYERRKGVESSSFGLC